MSYAEYQSDMEDIRDWVSQPYPEEDEVVPHTPKEESDYDPTMPLPLPKYQIMMIHLKMERNPSRKRSNMTEILVECPQIVRLTHIHLPIRFLRRLMRRTLLSWSLPERLLLYYTHPQADPSTTMLWDPGL